MLSSCKLMGFLTTRDYDRAKKFFVDVLGFKFVSHDQFALVVETDNNMIRIVEIKEAVPAPYTVLGWEVQSIDEVAGWLQQRGVVFEKYPWMQEQIWTAPGGDRVAWFKDPDGNVLSISQHVNR